MRILLATIVVLALGAFASPAHAQSNLGFMRDAPAAQFNQADFDLMYAAGGEVIRSKKIGLSKSWENPDTGNGGSIKLLRIFTATDGRDCRRVRVTNRAKAIEGVATMNVCAGADGKWLLDSEARPAK